MSRKDSGFGLLPMLISLAVGAVIIAGLAEAVMTMLNSQRTVELSQDSKLIGDEFEMILRSKQGCSEALNGQLVAASLTPSDKITVISPTLHFASGDFVASPNAVLPDARSLRVDRVFLGGTPDEVVTLSTGKIRKVATLNLAIKKDSSAVFSPSMKPRSVRIHAITDGSSNLLACVAETPEVGACIANGGIYDASAANPAESCLPYRHCQWGGSYVPPGSPGSFVNQFTNDYSCPVGWTAQQTGTVSEAYECSKFQVCNRLTPVITCMQCAVGVAGSNPAPSTGSIDVGQDLQELDQTQDFIDHQLQCEADGKTLEECPYNPPN